MKKKLIDLIIILPFMLSIFTISVLNEIKPAKDNSFIENRTLAKKPDFSLKDFKEYTVSYEKFYSDQFVKREDLLTVYTQLQINLNKSSIQNVYMNNGWLLGKVDNFSEKDLDTKAQSVVDINENLYNKTISYFSVPHKGSALSHLYPKYDTSITKHLENKNYLLNKLNSNNISAYNLDEIIKSKFSESELESMYYKTDHHWNAFGAYAVMQEILNKLNIPFDDSLYKITETSNKKFLGSYNRKLGSLFSKDEVLSYINPNNTTNIKMFAYVNGEKKQVNPKSYLSTQRDKGEVSYGGFYQGDLPYLKVVNKNSTTDRKILIIRDSYQAPTTLMFSSVFREVEIIDDRHIATINKTLDELIKESDATDIIYFKYL